MLLPLTEPVGLVTEPDDGCEQGTIDLPCGYVVGMTERKPYVKPTLTKLKTRWPDMGPEQIPTSGAQAS
jgi:hypothetical protein